jgi:alpha-tubulin suppressor-like RCC1 family protein
MPGSDSYTNLKFLLIWLLASSGIEGLAKKFLGSATFSIQYLPKPLMFKKTILASIIAAASFSALATDFYVVVPVQGRMALVANINVALNTALLPAGVVGQSYVGFDLKSALSVTGDAGYNATGVKWSVVSGALPAGLTMASNGIISGTPTAGGTGSFSVKASYKTKSGQQSYQVIVGAIEVALASGVPPESLVGAAFSYDLKSKLTVTGDAAFDGSGVTWAIVSNTLPAGLTLLTNGTISGTPLAAGSGSITARATYKGAKGDQIYQVVTLNIVVGLATATLPSAKVGTAYAAYDFKPLLSVSGDPVYSIGNVSFSTSGTLPPGLTLSSTGVLAGTPTAKNSTGANFQVIASYKTKTGQQVYTIVVNGQYLDVTQISAGGSHTCAVTTSGGAKCWGRNNLGQLGDGTTTNRLTPVDVVGLTTGVASIQGSKMPGDYHSYTCAVTVSGGAKCWGGNLYGQLGDGTTNQRLSPVTVSGLSSGVASISPGAIHTCAVTNSGGAKCWGYGGSGNLGNGSFSLTSLTPVDVSGLAAGVARIRTGHFHTCAVTGSGGAKCWGDNQYGQLGDAKGISAATPVAVDGLSAGVASISAGEYHSCAVTTSGSAKCWGANDSGQLGDGTTDGQTAPVDVTALTSSVVGIDSSYAENCAVTTAGGIQCWGNYSGRNIAGLTGVTSVSLGGGHTCVTTTLDGAKCWGTNLYGALGNNTTTYSAVPVNILP